MSEIDDLWADFQARHREQVSGPTVETVPDDEAAFHAQREGLHARLVESYFNPARTLVQNDTGMESYFDLLNSLED
jgi:hypothetical protein